MDSAKLVVINSQKQESRTFVAAMLPILILFLFLFQKDENEYYLILPAHE